jgi:hypothetical protein
MSSIIKSCKDSEIQRDYMMVERINKQYHTTGYETFGGKVVAKRN